MTVWAVVWGLLLTEGWWYIFFLFLLEKKLGGTINPTCTCKLYPWHVKAEGTGVPRAQVHAPSAFDTDDSGRGELDVQGQKFQCVPELSGESFKREASFCLIKL